MAGTIIADAVQAASASQMVIKNGVSNTPPTIQDSAGTQIGTFCRAWVNFNGTGTVAIRASFNVSSITDNGTGDYTINFTNALPDADYVVEGTANNLAGASGTIVAAPYNAAPSTSAIRVYATDAAPAARDSTYVYVAIFR